MAKSDDLKQIDIIKTEVENKLKAINEMYEKQQAINKAAWNEFEKTGDFSALLDIRFIISDNVKKELKGKENAIQKV